MDKYNYDDFLSTKNHYIDRYKSYVNSSHMPSSLIDLSIKGLEKLGQSDIYVMYPRLFMEPLGIKDEGVVEDLCIAGYLYFQSLMTLDRIYDLKGHSYNLFDILSLTNLQEESIKILSSVFPKDSGFWLQWKLRKSEFLESLSFAYKKGFSLNSFKKLSINKAAFAKIAIDSLYYYSNEKNNNAEYISLLKSHDSFSVATQILDDIQDIYEDAVNRQPNIALEKLFQKSLIRKNVASNQSADDLKKTLHYSGTSLELFKVCKRHLLGAQKEIEDLDDCYFNVILKQQLSIIDKKISNLTGILEIINVKRKMTFSDNINASTPIVNEWQSNVLKSAIVKGVNFILEQKKSDFLELKHFMFLGQEENFRNKVNAHYGDVFQRAMLVEILYDTQEFLNSLKNGFKFMIRDKEIKIII